MYNSRQNFLVRDLAPEQPQPTIKTQKLKKRNKKEKKPSVEDVTEAGINNEDEFIITSKSKAHKKIKIDPKNAFGGNILRPRFVSFLVQNKSELRAQDNKSYCHVLSVNIIVW